MTGNYDVVIVGGGHAGAQTAIALRQNGFEGSIALIGKEDTLPYDRPSLSKDYLSDRQTMQAMHLRTATFWNEQTIALHLGRTVERLEPTAKQIFTGTGEAYGYQTLVWATGGTARRLPCASPTGGTIHTIREVRDVDAIKRQIPAAQRIIVIGGGYLGLEAAAALREMGKSVVVIESSDRLLARVTGATISRFYEDEHRSRGVDIRLSSSVVGIIEDNARVTGVTLATGETVLGDMIIVAVGLEPAVQPLLEAGASGSNAGILVDEACRTSLPNIYAIGDCTLQSHALACNAQSIRLESISNANDQANSAARSITGAPQPSATVPWFWSNQYDLRLQTAGLTAGHDQTVLRGEPKARSFSVAYLRTGRLIAFDCVNAPKDFMQGKALLLRNVTPDLNRLADPTIPLRELSPSDRPAPARPPLATTSASVSAD